MHAPCPRDPGRDVTRVLLTIADPRDLMQSARQKPTGGGRDRDRLPIAYKGTATTEDHHV